MPVKRKVKRSFWQSGKIDIPFLSLVLILLSVGLIMLFSASYAYSDTNFGNSYHFISRQAIFAVIGVAIMLIVSKIDYHFYKKIAWVFYGGTLLLLGLLLVLPPMVEDSGVKRWFAIGSFSFQPSEFAKIAVVILFASWLSSNPNKIKKARYIFAMLSLLAIPCVLVVLEPHLSATILIFVIGIILLIVGGLPKAWILEVGS